MISKKLQDALNEQLNREFYSEYLYLSMVAYCRSIDLNGIANFFHIQCQEEHAHAMKIFNFLLDRDGKVVLSPIDAVPTKYKSVIEVFEKTLDGERYVSRCIDGLLDMATKENDHAVTSFLKWFVDEQVEEEAMATNILGRLKLIGGQGHGLLMIDSELGSRTYNPVPSK